MFHPRGQAEVGPRQGPEGGCVPRSTFDDRFLTVRLIQHADYFKNDWHEDSQAASGAASAKGTENVGDRHLVLSVIDA